MTDLVCGQDVDDPTLQQRRQPGHIARLSMKAQGLLDRWGRLSGARTRLLVRLGLRKIAKNPDATTPTLYAISMDGNGVETWLADLARGLAEALRALGLRVQRRLYTVSVSYRV